MLDFKIIGKTAISTARLNNEYGGTGIGGSGGKGNRLLDEVFAVGELYGLLRTAVVFHSQVKTSHTFGFAPAGDRISGVGAEIDDHLFNRTVGAIGADRIRTGMRIGGDCDTSNGCPTCKVTGFKAGIGDCPGAGKD